MTKQHIHSHISQVKSVMHIVIWKCSSTHCKKFNFSKVHEQKWKVADMLLNVVSIFFAEVVMVMELSDGLP